MVPRDAWDLAKVPAHLRLTYRIRGADGAVLAHDKDLDEIRRAFAGAAADSVTSAHQDVERTGMVGWELDDVPRELSSVRAGHRVTGYPALVDEADTVALRVLTTPQSQETSMRGGVRRLASLAVPSPLPRALEAMDNAARLTLGLNPHGSTAALLADCWTCAVDSLLDDAGDLPWSRHGFDALVLRVRRDGEVRAEEVLEAARAALAAAHEVQRRLGGRTQLSELPARTDMVDQWARLVHPGFLTDAGLTAVRHYPRYFAAMSARLDALAADVRRDAVLMRPVAELQQAYLNRLAALAPGELPGASLRRVRWLLEELRVSVWAQRLGTAQPVSAQRVQRALADA